jgi:hypothetical protein
LIRPRPQGMRRARLPDFAVDPHPAGHAFPGHDLALGVGQRLAAGNDRSAPRPQQHREDQEEESGGDDGRSGHDGDRQSKPGRVAVEHHHRAEDEGDDPAEAEHAERADEGFRYHQGNAEQNEAGAGIIDRQEVEGEQRDDHADRADRAGQNRARIQQLKNQSIDPEQQEQVGDVGVGDGGEEPRSPIGRHGNGYKAGRRQADGLAGYHHGSPVDLAQQIGHIVGDHVDDVQLERIDGREAHRAADGFNRPIGVAPVEFGEAADVGRCIIEDFAGFGVFRRAAGGTAGLARGCVAVLALGGRLRLPAGKERQPLQLNRRRGSEIGPGRHRRDSAGVGDVGAGARGPRAARRHIGGHRHRRRENRANDFAHRRVEPARRIHAQDHETGVARSHLREFA